jgi:hypothetical protein
VRYLVMVMKLGRVRRYDCTAAGAALTASIYGQSGWAVTVLSRIGGVS